MILKHFIEILIISIKPTTRVPSLFHTILQILQYLVNVFMLMFDLYIFVLLDLDTKV